MRGPAPEVMTSAPPARVGRRVWDSQAQRPLLRPLFGGELFGSAAVPRLGGGCVAEGVESVSVWARRERQRGRVWAVRVSAQIVGGGAVLSYVPVRALIKPVLEPCPANAAKLL